MKTIHVLLFALLSFVPSLAQAQFTYTMNGTDTRAITGYTGPGGSITLPSSVTVIDGSGHEIVEQYTEISAQAFDGNSTITSVTIPSTYQKIDAQAFYNCLSVTNVSLGNGLKYIGTNAFYKCAFSKITIPNSVTNIDYEAFQWCTKLSSITIPDGVTSLGAEAFLNCFSLTNAVVGKGITHLNDGTFESCAFTSFTTGTNVTSLGAGVFAGCGYLTNVVLGSGITTISASTFESCGFTSFTVSTNITSLGNYAFANCEALTNIVIGNEVTNIGLGSFYECNNLRNVQVGYKVASIGDQAFIDCSNVVNITFWGNAPTLLGTGTFLYLNSQTETVGPLPFATVYYLPGTTGWSSTYGGLPTVALTSTLTSGGFEFTDNNGSLIITGYNGPSTNATIPSSIYGFPVTSIAAEAFANNQNLTGITIPDSVTNIGVEAFYNCANLANVILPSNISTLGVETFYNCASLPNITIPASVTSLGAEAFDNCASLIGITFLGNPPMLGSLVFNSDFATVYYFYGTTGWGTVYGGLTTVELAWTPQIVGKAGIQANNFDFTIIGTNGMDVVVDASTNLINWLPIWTNTLSGTFTNFTDPQWANYPRRFYRTH